jgi:TatA/E family protein of Tat protein translocase
MNLLGMGPMELILIVVLALIVFGPAKLPEIMGQVGKAVNDFRRATSDLSDEFNRTIKAELEETRGIVDEARSVMGEARSTVFEAHSSVNSAVAGATAPVRTATPSGTTTSTPNGASSEPPGNGAVPAEPPGNGAVPESSLWSWETSSAPASDSSAEAAAAEPALAGAGQDEPPADLPDELPAAEQPPAEPARPTQERAARDELSPPY